MTVLRSIVMAFACFSQVPMPHIEWKPQSMRYMMCAFPLIGILIGLLLAAWSWLCGALGFGPVLLGAGFTLVPLCVTGGIHMDGFADTCDALASNAPPERRREILKDPHAGAFAVIGVGAYLVAYLAFATEIDIQRALVPLAIAPALSRCLSGIATVVFPLSSQKGMLADEQESSAKGRVAVVLVCMACACVAGLIAYDVTIGLVMTVAALLCFGGLYALSRRTFGGMSGDLAGFFLQMCELALLICVVVACKAVALG